MFNVVEAEYFAVYSYIYIYRRSIIPTTTSSFEACFHLLRLLSTLTSIVTVQHEKNFPEVFLQDYFI